MSPKKILFLLPSLNVGGSERVFATLAAHLDSNEFEIHLGLLEKVGPLLKSVPHHVRIYDFKSTKTSFALFKLWRLINRIKPDFVFALNANFCMVVMILKLAGAIHSKIIFREQILPGIFLKKAKFYRLKNRLYKILVKRTERIICQSQEMIEDLVQKYDVPREKIVLIYNPLDTNTIQQKAKSEPNPFLGFDGLNICSAGRLIPQKRFDRLIRAFKEVQIPEPSHLWILGGGPLLEDLKKLRDQLDLTDRVHFVGIQENPFKWFYHADLFVLSSDFEGVPNVLLEAMACGCPVLAFYCPGGTREVMELTGNADYLANDLEIRGEHLNRKKGVPAGLVEHFDVRKIVKKYRDLLL